MEWRFSHERFSGNGKAFKLHHRPDFLVDAVR
jgi:hypothetical protein